MKNLFKVFGIIALVAIIGFYFAACDTGGGGGTDIVNYTFNGDWTDNAGEKINLTNGNFVVTENGTNVMKGTYTENGNSLTFTPTHVWGSYVGGGLGSSWYTKDQIRNQFGSSANDTLNALFAQFNGTVNGSTLTIIFMGQTDTYTKSGGGGGGGNNNSGAPTIITVSLLNGTVGVSYNQTLSAMGETPITWSRESGTLPAGLTLSSAGVISGTPTTAATSTFTVKAINAKGNDTRQLSITIATANSGSGTWTAVTNSPFGTSYNADVDAIAYGNDTFVAGGYETTSVKKMAYSSDGITWTSVNISNNINTMAIAYGNGKFVTGNAYSTDNGKTWTTLTNSQSFGANTIAYGNNMFVAGGNSGAIATSTDGTTWTAVENAKRPFGTGTNAPVIRAIAFGGGKFVAGSSGGAIATSTDGTNWTLITTTAFDYLYVGSSYEETRKAEIMGITYGNGKFVAVGRGDGVGSENIGKGCKIAYSTDGATWIPVNTSTIFIVSSGNQSSQLGPYAIASGTNKFVVVGEQGLMAYSTDGVAWTHADVRSIFTTHHIKTIAYGNGTFVAGCQGNGLMAYSTGN